MRNLVGFDQRTALWTQPTRFRIVGSTGQTFACEFIHFPSRRRWDCRLRLNTSIAKSRYHCSHCLSNQISLWNQIPVTITRKELWAVVIFIIHSTTTISPLDSTTKTTTSKQVGPNLAPALITTSQKLSQVNITTFLSTSFRTIFWFHWAAKQTTT